jgi:hypothetical protein
MTQIEPGLLDLERDARSIAHHAERDWFPKWIRRCTRLGMLAGSRAQRPELRDADALAVAVDHLVRIYRAERAAALRS